MSVTNGFEKHAQTAIQVILVALTIWVGSAIVSLRDSAIRMEEKYTQTRESLIELKAEIAALRLALANAAERNVNTMQQLRDIENRVQTLERRRTSP